MKVKISERAKNSRNQIVSYILRTFGERAVLDFRKTYRDTKRFLAEHPESSPKEEHLSTDEFTYHFTYINGLTKLVYRVDGEVVYIVDMWDVRKEPPTSIYES